MPNLASTNNIYQWDLQAQVTHCGVIPSADNQLFIYVDQQGQIYSRNILNQVEKLFQVDQKCLPITAFVVGESVVAIGYQNSKIQVLDLQKRELRATLEGHKSGITHLQLCNGARNLVSCAGDHTIKLWDLALPQASQGVPKSHLLRTFQGHGNQINSIDIYTAI